MIIAIFVRLSLLGAGHVFWCVHTESVLGVKASDLNAKSMEGGIERSSGMSEHQEGRILASELPAFGRFNAGV